MSILNFQVFYKVIIKLQQTYPLKLCWNIVNTNVTLVNKSKFIALLVDYDYDLNKREFCVIIFKLKIPFSSGILVPGK